MGGKDYLNGIENIIGTNYVDNIIGDDKKNYIFGGLGADILSGGKGNDSLEGGAGNDLFKATSYDDGSDVIDGEKDGVTDSGTDTVDYSVITDTTYHLEVNLTSGNALIKDNQSTPVTHQTDTLKNIENVTGTSGEDTFVGDSENNVFDGKSGNDTVSYSNITGTTAITIDLKNDTATGDGTDTLTSIDGGQVQRLFLRFFHGTGASPGQGGAAGQQQRAQT